MSLKYEPSLNHPQVDNHRPYGRQFRRDIGVFLQMTDSLGGVPREQKMLKGHLPRVIYHQVYYYTKIR